MILSLSNCLNLLSLGLYFVIFLNYFLQSSLLSSLYLYLLEEEPEDEEEDEEDEEDYLLGLILMELDDWVLILLIFEELLVDLSFYGLYFYFYFLSIF